jgi:hypothetical protein
MRLRCAGVAPSAAEPAEDVAQEATLLLGPRLVRAVAVLVALVIIVMVFGVGVVPGSRRLADRAGDDLVQLAAVEPRASAFGAVVDLHTLALGHQEIDLVADGTLHGRHLSLVAFLVEAARR